MRRYHVRRTDREITDAAAIDDVIRRGRFATIALCHAGEPYAVTLSYGFDAEARALYFHVAPEGRKIDAIAEDPRACATIVVDGGYEPGACKHHYESVVITGTMRIVSDGDEARHGMRVLVGQLEPEPDAIWERNGLDGDAVYGRLRVARLDMEHVTAKAGS